MIILTEHGVMFRLSVPSVLSFGPPRLHGVLSARGKRSSGQAIVEFAISFPLLFVFFLGMWNIWSHYTRVSSYTDAAGSVAEYLARGQAFSTSGTGICAIIQTKLTGSGTCDTSQNVTVYMQVEMLDASGIAVGSAPNCTVGTAPATSVPGTIVAPADTGWSLANGMSIAKCAGTISPNSPRSVRVSIWGYQKAGIASALVPIPNQSVPTGVGVAPVIVVN